MKRKRSTARRTKSAKEVDSIIDLVVHLLNRRQPKSKITREISKALGLPDGELVTTNTTQSYVCRARERILESASKTKDETKTEALRFYESVVNGPDSTVKEKIAAQERIDKLIGHEASQSVLVKGDPSAPIIVNYVEVEVVLTRDNPLPTGELPGAEGPIELSPGPDARLAIPG